MRRLRILGVRRDERTRGQAMVELALVLPLFVMLLVGIIVLGIGVFYQQQLTNAAREAARYASIHSATAMCPTVSTLAPTAPPRTYSPCDTPAGGWPFMTAAGRHLLFGLPPSAVNLAACWSGYREDTTNAYDAPPPGDYLISSSTVTIASTFAQCTIGGADPTTNPSAIGCNSGLAASTVDEASNLSEAPGRIVANTVTAYACYVWSPPMAGFLLIPQAVTLRAVITEPIERQQ
ncbi:MAG: TadE/TadG family type IV pilus assembly protein [Chloroflexota bacterium]